MPRGPLGYLRSRLARSIDWRVETASRIASDAWLASMTDHVDHLWAAQRSEQQRWADEQARVIIEQARALEEQRGVLEEQQRVLEDHRQVHLQLTMRLDDIVRIAADDRRLAHDQLRELADDAAATVATAVSALDALTAKISATNTSFGTISASLTDAQRRQAYFVEQLARRVEGVEQSAPRPSPDPAKPAP